MDLEALVFTIHLSHSVRTSWSFLLGMETSILMESSRDPSQVMLVAGAAHLLSARSSPKE